MTPAQFQAALALLAVCAIVVGVLGYAHVLSGDVTAHLFNTIVAGTVGALVVPRKAPSP
jgi:hypothetical protein